MEAVEHLTKGLKLLQMLPETPEIIRQELTQQLALGAPLQIVKGYSASEAGAVYSRARELCRQLGETPRIFPALFGLYSFSITRGELQTAYELSQRLLSRAQSVQDPALLLEVHQALGQTWYFLGELVQARAHLEHEATLYDPQQHRSHALPLFSAMPRRSQQ